MLIIPAIDIKDGHCVRLFQGEMDKETIYFESPLAAAKHWVAEGARFIHVVDLNGAVEGRPVHTREVETICRYDLPVCIVIFNNNGIYRGTDVNPLGGSDAATTVFVKDSRYEKMMDAFGGVGAYVTTPDELKRAVSEAMDSGRPTLINAAIDPAAGSESGRIGNLNPQSKLRKK